MHTGMHTGTQTHRQTDRHTHTQAHRQTDRQTPPPHTHTDRHTPTHTHTPHPHTHTTHTDTRTHILWVSVEGVDHIHVQYTLVYIPHRSVHVPWSHIGLYTYPGPT